MPKPNPGLSRSIRCDQWLELLDELSIGAFIVNCDRRIESINYTALALMGLRVTEAVGKDCRDIFCGVPCLVSCMLEKNGDAGPRYPQPPYVDDEDSPLLTRMATPIFDSAGRVSGCLTILQDHTPIADLINRVHYEERTLKIILDHLDVGIFTVNRGGLITFFNTAAERISGYSRRQVLGKPCSAIFEGESAPDVCTLKAAIADGSLRSSQHGQLITAEGVSIPIRANYMALRNEKGTVVGGLATFHDLTLIHRLNQAISDRYTFHDMIGKSPAMQKIFEMVSVVAGSRATVLIEGATGTGKDLLARVIHSAGKRADKPLVKVNCAAIPDNLLESELFGYSRGAFTGADRDKPGRFQLADGGTIFLDEIGDLPISLQAKLLRVIEDREFFPLGSRSTVRVDVRIISATNRRLKELVANREFREDLYYRLNVMQIDLPQLAERREDLPLLIPHITRKLCVAMGRQPPDISGDAMHILLNHEYPGNVRELENILEHALIVCRGELIQSEHLPVSMRHRPHVIPPVESDRRPIAGNGGDERRRILEALTVHGGHRGMTARSLGMDRSTLWRKMKRYGIES